MVSPQVVSELGLMGPKITPKPHTCKLPQWVANCLLTSLSAGICEQSLLCPAESLLAGIPQKVKFTVTTGHYTMKSGDTLQLSNADAMPILYHPESKAVIYSNTRGKPAAEN